MSAESKSVTEQTSAILANSAKETALKFLRTGRLAKSGPSKAVSKKHPNTRASADPILWMQPRNSFSQSALDDTSEDPMLVQKPFDLEFIGKGIKGSKHSGCYREERDGLKICGLTDKELLEKLEKECESITAESSKLGFVFSFSLIILDRKNPSGHVKTIITDIKALSEFINTFKKEHPELSQPSESSSVGLISI